MTNRIFACSKSNFTSRNSELDSEQPFNFALKQRLAFTAELETQLLEFEQRFKSNLCAVPFAQPGASAPTPATDIDDSACQRCTYDDFGLVEGLELDVSWM